MKSNISKHFWLQNNGNNFHHTVLVNFIVSVLDETQTHSSHPAWESKQPTSRSESDPTRLRDPTAATLNIYWTSHWKNHNLILRLKFKWLFKQNVYSGSALFHMFFAQICSQFETAEMIHQHYYTTMITSEGRHRYWQDIWLMSAVVEKHTRNMKQVPKLQVPPDEAV